MKAKIEVRIHDDGRVFVPGNPLVPSKDGLRVCEVQANAQTAKRLIGLSAKVVVNEEVPSPMFLLCCVTANDEPYVEPWSLPDMQ